MKNVLVSALTGKILVRLKKTNLYFRLISAISRTIFILVDERHFLKSYVPWKYQIYEKGLFSALSGTKLILTEFNKTCTVIYNSVIIARTSSIMMDDRLFCKELCSFDI